LVTGRRPEHALLEEELARFEEVDSALLFSSGYAANVAAVVALVGRTDGIFSDRLNHASLIDGCRLSGAAIHRYRHVSPDDLEQQLKTHRAKYRQAIIVTDSLFSMDGDLAPVPEICRLAEQYDCLVLVDEAHATGVYGTEGAGWCHETKCSDRVLVRTGTLSKSIGGLGGFLIGPSDFVQLAIHRARSFIFSTAMPAAMAVAARCAIRLIINMSRERQELRQTAQELRKDLVSIGCQIGGTDSPIIPVYIGDSERCVEFSNRLRQMGCYVPAIRPPSVPSGSALLRISITSAHQRTDLELLCSAIAKLRDILPAAKDLTHVVNGGE
jgi:8-amino-7-oxononanoate synthase